MNCEKASTDMHLQRSDEETSLDQVSGVSSTQVRV